MTKENKQHPVYDFPERHVRVEHILEQPIRDLIEAIKELTETIKEKE